MNLFQFTNTANTLAIVLSVLIPGLSALIARPHWSAGVVGVLTGVIAAVNGFFTTWAAAPNANHYDWKHALALAASSYILAAIAHFQGWRETKWEAKLRSI